MGFIQLSGILILCALACGISAEMDIDRGLNSMLDAIVPQGDDHLDENFRMSDASASDLEKGTDHKSAVSSDTNPDSDNNSVQQEAILLGLEPEKEAKSDEQLMQADPSRQEPNLKRADLCSIGDKCVYSFVSTSEAHSERQDGSDHKLERQLHSNRYTVIVEPHTKLGDNTMVYQIRGDQMVELNGVHYPEKETKSFAQCSIRVLQSQDTGEIHHSLVPRAESGVLCSKTDSAFLVRSLHALSPVIRHLQNNQTFSHGEKFGQDHRKVDCFVDQVNDNEHSISATVHHHHYSAQPGGLDEAFDQMMWHRKSKHTTHVRKESVLAHNAHGKFAIIEGGETTAEDDEPLSRSADTVEGHSSVDGAGAHDNRNRFIEVNLDVKKISEQPTSPHADMSHMPRSQFVAESTTVGWDENKDPTSVEQKEKIVSELEQKTELEQTRLFYLLVKDMPKLTAKHAFAHMKMLAELPAVRRLISPHLRDPAVAGNAQTSSILIGSLNQLEPHPTDEILALVHADDLNHNQREQAILALYHVHCNGDNIKALIDLSSPETQAELTEVALDTFALHIQHMLVHRAMACSKGKADVTRFVQTAQDGLMEMLAQKDWFNVHKNLEALGNSKLEGHLSVLQKVLAHPALPEKTRSKTLQIVGKLHGEAPRQFLQSSKDKKGKGEGEVGIKYQWFEKKFPADPPDDSPAEKPKFQAAFELNSGLNMEKGLYVEAPVKVKLGSDKYKFTLIQLDVSTLAEVPKDKQGKKKCFGTKCFGLWRKITIAGKYVIYSEPKQPEEDKEAEGKGYKKDKGPEEDEDEEEKNTTVLGVAEEENKIGRCGTDINTLNGVAASLKWTMTFFKLVINIPAAAAVIVLSLELEGTIGIAVGAGALGGDEKAPCQSDEGFYTATGSNKVCSKTVKCGDGKDFFKGQLAFVEPSASISVTGEASASAFVIKAGVGLEINLVDIKVPASIEHFGAITKDDKEGELMVQSEKQKDDKDGFPNCKGLNVKTELGAGKLYLFVESWASGRHVWVISKWDGAKWQWPAKGHFWGDCSKSVAIPRLPKPPSPNPADSMCLVAFYDKEGYKSTKDPYIVQSSYRNDDFNNMDKWILPEYTQKYTRSVKTSWNCHYIELIDNDYGSKDRDSNNAYIFDNGDDAGFSALPDDIKEDIAAVRIRALKPHAPGGKTYSRWRDDSCCEVATFMHDDYVGFQEYFSSCLGPTKFNVKANFESYYISGGCEKVEMCNANGDTCSPVTAKKSYDAPDAPQIKVHPKKTNPKVETMRLSSYHFKSVPYCTDRDGDGVDCGSASIGEWEKFDAIWLGKGEGNFAGMRKFAMRGRNPKTRGFCAAMGDNDNAKLVCRTDAKRIGVWETFYMKEVKDLGSRIFEVNIKSGRTGKYCSVQGNKEVLCNRDNAGDWETFYASLSSQEEEEEELNQVGDAALEQDEEKDIDHKIIPWNLKTEIENNQERVEGPKETIQLAKKKGKKGCWSCPVPIGHKKHCWENADAKQEELPNCKVKGSDYKGKPKVDLDCSCVTRAKENVRSRQKNNENVKKEVCAMCGMYGGTSVKKTCKADCLAQQGKCSQKCVIAGISKSLSNLLK